MNGFWYVFRGYICFSYLILRQDMINHAEKRIFISSLYIGSEEEELARPIGFCNSVRHADIRADFSTL